MKYSYTFIILFVFCFSVTRAQTSSPKTEDEKAIYALVGNYVKARETKDVALLKSILIEDLDQLVSTGVWRYGRDEAMKGMMQSSKSKPGERTITIQKVRFIGSDCCIADARYQIQNQDGTSRKMWSTFVAVSKNKEWKITAIRNMKPAQ